jgi:hypothetical protein
METQKESPLRDEPREVKILTLRMPLEVHKRVEDTARGLGLTINKFITDAADAAVRQRTGGVGSEPSATVEPVMLTVDLDSFAGRSSINVEALEKLAATVGRTVIKASYSVGIDSEIRSSRQQLLQRHYRHEELASRDALRLRIAADCLIAMTDVHVKNVVLVTADEEFGFLSAVVEQRGGAVHAVGVKPAATTSPGFIRSFRSFRYYDHLDKPPESAQLRQLRAEFAEILVQIAYRAEQRGSKPVGAAIIPLLRDRHPELSIELLEIRSWRELAEVACDLGLLTAVEPSGADFVLRLSEKGRVTGQRLLERADAANAQRSELDRVSTAINDIIRTEMPSSGTRGLIFNAVQSVLDEVESRDAVNLVELSYRVVERLVRTGIQQNSVYRLLNGLYRGGVFDVQTNPTNENDPRVLRARIPASQFDDAFVLNLMRLRGRFPGEADPQLISTVLYSSADQAEKVQRMLRVASDNRYSRTNLHEALNAIKVGSG